MIIIWVILGAAVLLFLQDRLYAHYWNKNLTVGLAFAEESATEGDTGVLCETVENRKILPLPALKVKFAVSRCLIFEEADGGSSVTDQFYRNDVLSVRPYMRHVRRLFFLCKKRGYYTITALDVVAGNLFLSRELPMSLKCDAQFYVYPRPWKEQSFLRTLQKLNGEILSRRHLLEDPFEYRGIREYFPGDAMRDINWKATARTGDLKVNMKNYTALKAVRLFVNLEDGALLRREDMLEASISMAAGAAAFFLDQGIRTALYTNGPDILTGDPVGMEASSGPAHMETINRGLARIDLSESAPRFRMQLEEKVLGDGNGAGDVFTIFISNDAQDDFQDLLCTCLEKGMGFAWLCPVQHPEENAVRPALEKYTHQIVIDGGWT